MIMIGMMGFIQLHGQNCYRLWSVAWRLDDGTGTRALYIDYVPTDAARELPRNSELRASPVKPGPRLG